MRSAFLDDARPEQVSHAVRDVLERKGAIVVEHRHSRIRFRAPPAHQTLSWTRAGYVGIYQHQGEQEAEVRLVMRALWPWRILWTVALVNVLVAIATIIVNPSGTAWSFLAIVTGLALVVAGIVYVATLRSVRAEERALLEDIEAEFARLPDVQLETAEERELRELEEELEGEIVRRRLERTRPPPEPRKGRRFSLRPKKDEVEAPEESLEERRARLLARKAELEARREAEREQGPP